jgi:ribulose 1,5-bisphosphate synthetase/thiazole synthase
VIWAAGGRLLNHPAGVMCRASQTDIFGHVTERYDVIIVGSGVGGGTLVHTLAPSGQRILLLERGNFLSRMA